MIQPDSGPPDVPEWAKDNGFTGWPDGPRPIKHWKKGPWTPHGRKHDWRYGWNGSFGDKFRADWELAKDLWNDDSTPIWGKIHAPLVFTGLSTFGWLFWFKARRRHKRVRRTYYQRELKSHLTRKERELQGQDVIEDLPAGLLPSPA